MDPLAVYETFSFLELCLSPEVQASALLLFLLAVGIFAVLYTDSSVRVVTLVRVGDAIDTATFHQQLSGRGHHVWTEKAD